MAPTNESAPVAGQGDEGNETTNLQEGDPIVNATPLTPLDEVLVRHAKDALLDRAKSLENNDFLRSITVLGYSTTLGRLLAGQPFPEYLPTAEKTIATLRAVAVELNDKVYVDDLVALADRLDGATAAVTGVVAADGRTTATTVATTGLVVLEIGNRVTVHATVTGRVVIAVGDVVAELGVANAHQLIDGLQLAVREAVA